MVFEEGFRAVLRMGGGLVVGLKSVETPAPVHGKRVLTQLRLSRDRLGLVINFGEVHLKDGIKRVANGLPGGIRPMRPRRTWSEASGSDGFEAGFDEAHEAVEDEADETDGDDAEDDLLVDERVVLLP